jgi:hypothetical protein
MVQFMRLSRAAPDNPLTLRLSGCIVHTMYIDIRFSKSAFKHGLTKADIKRAVINVLYDDILDEANDKHLLMWFDCNSNLIEILYNVINDDTIRVFHAMKCTDEFIKLLDR